MSSTSSCAPAILSSCPTDRFSNFSDLLKWDLIPVNPSEIIIRSNNNQLCLSSTSNGTEVCPCDNGVAQRWTLNNKEISSSVNGECLSLIGNQISVEKCQPDVNTMSWNVYNVVPNTVNLYTKTDFADKPTRLLVNNTYNSNSLPTEIFSSPFSLEVPPGFELVIDRGINNVETVDSDVAQMPPISLLNTVLLVRLKPGVIIYEYPDYFGASEFNQVDVQVPSIPFPIGSVLVPQGYRGVIWTNSNFTGNNLGLFEPIANFTGVSVITKQNFVASLDISATTCKFECGSNGICSNNGTCSCKLGFTGERCEQCSSGFFGPNCQQCNCTGNKGTCDDGMTGTGACKCNSEFIGDNCNICAPGFVGSNCIECKCGSGSCNAQGGCSCNAGFAPDPNTNQCTKCNVGYFMSGTDCKACPPGCDICDQPGKCTTCHTGLSLANDNSGKCVTKGQCATSQYFDDRTLSCLACDNTCKTCFGPSPSQCLECNAPYYYLEKSCVSAIPDGRCSSNQAFFIDTSQKICEACPSSCSECSIPNFTDSSPVESMKCSQCMPGFFLDGGQCVKNCSEGSFANSSNSTCQACDKDCASCSGPEVNKCINCSNKNFFSSNGTCSQTPCPSGFVAINTVCTKCHPDCSECSNIGINQCTKCPSNRPIFKDGQCIEVCPMGTYEENGTCQNCNAECSTCVGPRADQCLGCNDQNKILLGGVCSGSCPAGSEMDKFEKICQNLDNGVVLPSGEVNDNNNINNSQEKPNKSFRLEWWHILLIVIGSLLLLIAIVLLIRYINIKKRKKKTKEFGDQVDENIVAQNLKNMLRATRGIPTQPEMSYNPSSDKEFEDSMSTPPAYNHKDGESYWKKERQQMRKKHVSITPEDYSNWKVARNNKDWDGFDIVTLENFNKAEYSGNPSGSRNDYRNSKGSICSKRSYTIPPGWDGNYEKYDWV